MIQHIGVEGPRNSMTVKYLHQRRTSLCTPGNSPRLRMLIDPEAASSSEMTNSYSLAWHDKE